jgi:hypothetical protein
MIVTVGAIVWLVTSPAFRLDQERVVISGLHYTDPTIVRQLIDLPADSTPNVFRLRTTQMQRALASLPAVARADVHVALPNGLIVAITERRPVVVLRNPAGSFILDSEGVALDLLSTEAADALGLPTVDDGRQDFAPDLEVGGRLDAVDLGAILRLGALTPELVGSSATALRISVDDSDGYVVTREPAGWRAVFGHYTPTLRPPDIIDRQVQCLRSLLATGETDVAVIYLAPLDEHCGTSLPRTTPSPTPTA